MLAYKLDKYDNKGTNAALWNEVLDKHLIQIKYIEICQIMFSGLIQNLMNSHPDFNTELGWV